MQVNNSNSSDTVILETDASTFRGKDKTSNDGLCFAAGTDLSPGGSNYAHYQVFNPASSGVICLVDKAYIASFGDAGIWLYSYDTALTTLVRNGVNKNIGGAAGVCEFRTQASSSKLGDVITMKSSTGLKVAQWDLDNPFVLGKGEGLILLNGTTNLFTMGGFEWREV